MASNNLDNIGSGNGLFCIIIFKGTILKLFPGDDKIDYTSSAIPMQLQI